MLALFVLIFDPYHHCASVFSIAVVFILIAGLTLIPAIFALMGRKAFWPFIPQVNEKKKSKQGFWAKASKLVLKHPAIITGSIMVVLLVGVFNVSSINFSFNLLKSFPDRSEEHTSELQSRGHL